MSHTSVYDTDVKHTGKQEDCGFCNFVMDEDPGVTTPVEPQPNDHHIMMVQMDRDARATALKMALDNRDLSYKRDEPGVAQPIKFAQELYDFIIGKED